MPNVQFKDYYRTLKLPRTADADAVRSAYRALARKHHPDTNRDDPGAEERFKEINEANEVLSDPAKRKMYDRYGEEWQRYRDAGFTGDEPAGRAATGRPGGVGGPPGEAADFGAWFAGRQGGTAASTEWTTYDLGNGGRDGAGFSDFFQVLFGGRGREGAAPGRGTAVRTRPRRGDDLEVGVEVTFDEAFQGTTRGVQMQAPGSCPTCDGTGLARGATCPTCDGSGVSTKAKTLEVRVPAGVTTGSRVRIAGQGGPGRSGGANGDVFLRVSVRPDPRFARDGDDLKTDVEVPVTAALLGGEAVVTTPTGRVALRIPPGTQPDRVFRLRGQGMPRLKGGERGDLLARTKVVLPTDLSEPERELVEQWRELRGETG